MRFLKIPVTIVFTLLVAFDAVAGYRLWMSGWPKSINLTNAGNVERVEVVPIRFTDTDWLILVLFIGLHALVLYLTWRSWKSSPVRS